MAEPVLVDGLTTDEQGTLNDLVASLDAKAPRNMMRSAYLDMKSVSAASSPMIAPYLNRIKPVLGWPSKACEVVARRTRLEGMAIPGADVSDFGIDQLISDNRYLRDVRQTHMAALTHAVSFEVVTAGGPGEPEAVITSTSAIDGTGKWNKRTRRLDSFLSVIDRDDRGRPTDFNLYLPGETIIVSARTVQDRLRHPLWVPVHPVIYKPRLDRPFGQSRISRAVISLTNSAMRSLLRIEGTADFYGTPHLILLGALLSKVEDDNGNTMSPWSFMQSAVNGIPDDDDAPDGLGRANIHQIQQASQQPHLDTIDTIAAAFAGETGIPVSSLGVGVKQANPTSADSYLASREDVISESEDAADEWGWAHVRTIQDAWLISSGEASLPPEMLRLRPVWRDARQTSRAANADATVKLVQAFPWMAESDAMLDTLGLDPAIVERLLADKRRAQARTSILPLIANGNPA